MLVGWVLPEDELIQAEDKKRGGEECWRGLFPMWRSHSNTPVDTYSESAKWDQRHQIVLNDHFLISHHHPRNRPINNRERFLLGIMFLRCLTVNFIVTIWFFMVVSSLLCSNHITLQLDMLVLAMQRWVFSGSPSLSPKVLLWCLSRVF